MRDAVDMEQVEQEARARWDSDPEIQAEFVNDWDTYIAFVRAEARGLVRILSGTVTSVRGKRRA